MLSDRADGPMLVASRRVFKRGNRQEGAQLVVGLDLEGLEDLLRRELVRVFRLVGPSLLNCRHILSQLFDCQLLQPNGLLELVDLCLELRQSKFQGYVLIFESFNFAAELFNPGRQKIRSIAVPAIVCLAILPFALPFEKFVLVHFKFSDLRRHVVLV